MSSSFIPFHQENIENEMMTLRRNATLSVLGFGIVLFVAILCRPYTATFSYPVQYTDVDDFGDIIGIDLGSTYSRVGIFRNNTFEIISDDQGRSAIPNYVAFPGPLVGFEAKEEAHSNLRNTVYDFRGLIGRKYWDSEVQKAIQELPYEVFDMAGEPVIKIGQKGDYTGWSPKEISGLVLKKLKSMAEIRLNTTVNYAVITVPYYFNEKQRLATKGAAEMANMSVLRMINEASAIGIAYHLDSRPCDEAAGRYTCTYILYDVKDSESSLTLLSIDRGVYEILGTAEWKDNKASSEKAQTSLKATSIERLLRLIKQLLIDAKLEKKDVDGIIVTGDPPRIPKVQGILEAYFPGTKALSPSDFGHDQAIVCGAARQGQLFNDEMYQDGSPQLMDVNVLSLGLETSNGSFLKVINRHTVIPTRKLRIVSTVTEGQGKVEIKILEGEREIAGENKLLGTLELTRIPWEPRGVVEIEVAFELDADEILMATAKVKGESEAASLVVPVSWRRYTEQEIEDIVKEGDTLHEEDLQQLIESPVKVLGGVDLWEPKIGEPETLPGPGFGVWRWLFG